MQVQIASPKWFFGVDASFELIAAVIALVVSITAYKIYKITKGYKHGWFGVAFFLLAIGLAARGMADLVIERVLTCGPSLREALPQVPGMSRTAFVFLAGYLTNIITSLMAYIILIRLSFDIKDRALMLLLFLIVVPALLLSGSYFLSYYWLSTIMLGFITYGYYRICLKGKTTKSRMVTWAFGLLALAQVQFVVSAFNVLAPLAKDIVYVTAHGTQILGFILILLALLRTIIK